MTKKEGHAIYKQPTTFQVGNTSRLTATIATPPTINHQLSPNTTIFHHQLQLSTNPVPHAQEVDQVDRVDWVGDCLAQLSPARLRLQLQLAVVIVSLLLAMVTFVEGIKSYRVINSYEVMVSVIEERQQVCHSTIVKVSTNAMSTIATSSSAPDNVAPTICLKEGDGGNGWTLHPFLPTNEEPAPRLWWDHLNVLYVVPSPNDDEDNAYGPRVGHGCCYCGDSWLVFFGGATTDGLSADVAILHIASTNWIKASWQDEPCPCPRYDHGMVYSLEQHAIYVFGGVAQTGNLNDLWCLELATWTWHEIAQQGSIPTPRAVHHLIDIEGRLLLFGGGEQNQTAVDDTCIYIFEIATRTWTKHAGHGDIPSPRQGHAVCVVQPQNLNLTDIVETTSSTTREACVLVHGGLHHGAFMNDMYQLNTCW
eukprot:gene7147-463_t